MSYTDRHIVETYTELFEGLSAMNKIELIESLSKSLQTEKSSKEANFYKSFGAFGSDKSPEKILTEIKKNRKFRTKEMN
ncbi:MAG: hypothetical protein QM541_13165 [Flavobacterium sp.]|nr:hypothetical protein [Flavobacterium sp.]